MTRQWYDNFDDYVKDFPEGEFLRNWILEGPHKRGPILNWCRDFPNKELYNHIQNLPQNAIVYLREKEPLVIFKGDGMHSGIVGDFLWAQFRCVRGWKYPPPLLKLSPDANNHLFDVMVHDCDDGTIVKHCPTLEEGLEWLNNLKELSPVSFNELMDLFGFVHE